MCRVYGITRAGFYAWRNRGPSLRAQQNETQVQQIRQIHRASRGIYGSPRVYRQLQKESMGSDSIDI